MGRGSGRIECVARSMFSDSSQGFLGRTAARLVRAVNGVILPDLCPVCRERMAGASGLCETCDATFKELGVPRCPGCGGSVDGILDLCSECLRAGERCWDGAVSVYAYGGDVRRVIHRFKYQKHTYLAPALGRRMARNWIEHGRSEVDAIVPVPLHWFRQYRRGYNQAALLAGIVGHELGVPVCRLLRRRRRTVQQARLDAAHRQDNVRSVFAMRRRVNASGLRVLLVDDVLTTGATLSAAAQVLRDAGAATISVLTVARG